MLDSLKLPSETKMKRVHHTDDRHYYTICSALRDVYAKVEDPDLKFKLRYATMLAKEIVDRLAEYDLPWLKKLYPRVGQLDKFR